MRLVAAKQSSLCKPDHPMLLDGVHVPLTVPFYADGECYLKKLEHNVRRYCLGPISGLLALSPGTEADGLSDEDQRSVLRTVAEAATAEKVLLAGIGRDSVREAVALMRFAADAGFDVALLAAPNRWPRLHGEQSLTGELALFFQAVADQSPLPLVLWSDAAPPSVQLSVDLLALLAGHGNVLGVYDSDLSVQRFTLLRERTVSVRREVTVTPVFAPVTGRMLKQKASTESSFVPADQLAGGSVTLAISPPTPALRTRVRQVSFQVMSAGSVRATTELLAEGVPGCMPTVAACAPQACHEVYAAFKDGNGGLANEKEERLWEADRVLAELGPAGLKYACDLNGFYGGRARLPHLALRAEERTRVEAVMKSVRQ